MLHIGNIYKNKSASYILSIIDIVNDNVVYKIKYKDKPSELFYSGLTTSKFEKWLNESGYILIE